MERPTVDVYEARGAEWIARRVEAPRRRDARALGAAADAVGPPHWRVDLGCGGGRYLAELGTPAVGMDASRTMLDHARRHHPRAPLIQGDLEALPFRSRSLAGAWASNSYLHLPAERLPLALADLHRALVVAAPLNLQVIAGGHRDGLLPDDDIGGRYFSSVPPDLLEDILTGAGFIDVAVDVDRAGKTDRHVDVHGRARRARTLADTVGPGMRILVCGLNPSVYAADAGIGFARPGNRFWPAALAAGVVSRDRDPRHALLAHGVGMTDVVKRATPRAADLSNDEYRTGMERIRRLVTWLTPRVLCFVGLEGYRVAVDPRASAGWQPAQLAGATPTYLMPSTSGLNANSRLDDLVRHLATAAAGPPNQPR